MSRVLVLAIAALAGCATIDVYHYQARPLPAGSEPLAVVSWTLQDLRNVSWSYGEPDPDPSRRATLEATTGGVTASAQAGSQGSPLDLTYSEIANGVHMVTESSGSWTVVFQGSVAWDTVPPVQAMSAVPWPSTANATLCLATVST